jgi:hypothetical protein
MIRMCKKGVVTVTLALAILAAASGLASGAVISVDARDDAGISPGQAADLWFVDSQTPPQKYLGPSADPGWTSYGGAGGVISWAVGQGIPWPWVLESAGNVWSPDSVVGEALTGLAADTYRIAPAAGAFQYSFADGTPPYNQYWWQLHILAHDVYVNGQLEGTASWILGSTTPYASAAEALQASMGQYLDVTLAQGGSLAFWIWDVNSIDNSGGLVFSVAPVPVPSTLALMAIGLAVLARRLRL